MALLFPHSSLLSHPIKLLPLFSSPNSAPFTPSPTLTFPYLTSKSPTVLLRTSARPSSSFTISETTDFGIVDDCVDEDLAGSPWEGAVVYRRDPSVCHVEYSTTLERLGLGKLSTAVSRSRASEMGIRVPARRGKEAPLGEEETPVLVSVDVTRRRRRLRLDGIVRTVITLGCNRCAEPAAECIFSNFTLLLSEDPIEEPDVINMGVMFGQDKSKNSFGSSNEEDEDEDIDLDDRLYFPSEEKEIDISKHIRDIVHVEITINAVCSSICKGLCLKCGTNLNKSSCNCSKEVIESTDEYGPLKGLRKRMQQT
ncbi:large ribosomal RNA subunit accumulation protein YCED homolog 1, chloroplastic [Typha latifolia]|uniref:large ribosomal RNA subunit accumulation protein YCED homolog 1, chloroplastic n=1 Tax=Typha latifolia TaxID=4733 RepID=UPI003C2E6539